MVKILNKFAIGCIVQWYEIEIVESYLQSVKNAVDQIENKKNVIIDLQLDCSQSLEKVDKKQTTISDIKERYRHLLRDIFGYDEGFDGTILGCDYNIKSEINSISGNLFTISDYRRTFNDIFYS